MATAYMSRDAFSSFRANKSAVCARKRSSLTVMLPRVMVQHVPGSECHCCSIFMFTVGAGNIEIAQLVVVVSFLAWSRHLSRLIGLNVWIGLTDDYFIACNEGFVSSPARLGLLTYT